MFSSDFFQQRFLGDTLENWIISLIIIFGSIFLARLLYMFFSKVIQQITSRTKTRLDDLIFNAIEKPMIAGIILAGVWFGLNRLIVDPKLDAAIKVAYKILVVLNATWMISMLAKSLIHEYLRPVVGGDRNKVKLDSHVISVIQKILVVIIWLVGGVMALHNAGVNVSALLAGLGLGGLAFALAAQDTVKNIFGGFTIFADRPFRIGDLVTIAGITGNIEDIGMRSTRLRTLDGRLVTIPNYKTIDDNIENISCEPSRRMELDIGLTYDTTPEKMELALSLLKNLPNEMPQQLESQIIAYFANFDDFSLRVTCFYYIRKEADINETQSAVNQLVLKQFDENNLSFAFSTQTISLRRK
ncbi:MAG: mechanosensitive ion channel family protein [Prevotellaceae bacterium]|jgi:MscS family membrane protein|nr:mechanosensitive ion channel family protein [Prevotellaceae bacterium]